MAQQAGADLSEIGRRFPSNPQFPQPEGIELEYIEMVFSEDSDSLPQAEGNEGNEGMRESQCEQIQGYSRTFSDKLDSCWGRRMGMKAPITVFV